MFRDSLEGLTPRKKIRIRNYLKKLANDYYLRLKYRVLREDLKLIN